ncbi:hypothetical protein BDZ91DRAFT_768264 [Kalaharituber pfeilii]|nr:hypothetical protein BDZ91DRAFT_768264 [Kalaharituber pfeilii]
MANCNFQGTPLLSGKTFQQQFATTGKEAAHPDRRIVISKWRDLDCMCGWHVLTPTPAQARHHQGNNSVRPVQWCWGFTEVHLHLISGRGNRPAQWYLLLARVIWLFSSTSGLECDKAKELRKSVAMLSFPTAQAAVERKNTGDTSSGAKVREPWRASPLQSGELAGHNLQPQKNRLAGSIDAYPPRIAVSQLRGNTTPVISTVRNSNGYQNLFKPVNSILILSSINARLHLKKKYRMREYANELYVCLLCSIVDLRGGNSISTAIWGPFVKALRFEAYKFSARLELTAAMTESKMCAQEKARETILGIVSCPR